MEYTYVVTVIGESIHHFAESYSEEEVELIKKFFDDMSNHGVPHYDIPCIEFDKCE